MVFGPEFLKVGLSKVRAAGFQHLTTTLVLLLAALLLARFSWEMPFVGSAERSLYDFRYSAIAPMSAQKEGVQLVVYDDQTVIATGKRTPLDRGLLTTALQRIDRMGAKSVGINILFTQPQPEDSELLGVLRSMKTPTYLAYDLASNGQDTLSYEQQLHLDHFVKRLRGGTTQPARSELDLDEGVVRAWPESKSLSYGHLAVVMSQNDARQVRLPIPGSAILFEEPLYPDRPVFSSLRIDLFSDPDLLPALQPQVKGKDVLVGGDMLDFQRFRTPLSQFGGADLSGGEVIAAMLHQTSKNDFQRQLSAWLLWAAALLIIIFAVATSLLELSFVKLLPLLIMQFGLLVGAPFSLQASGFDTLGTPAAGWVLAWILAFTAVSSSARASGAVERRFAHSALGKFLPKDVAQEIIAHPEKLTLSGTKSQLSIVFSDLEGFTSFSHQVEPEVVAKVLNEYLDCLSAVILDHGGLIDKYVGDAIVSFWGAPIARTDDARHAALAGYALWKAGEEFRAKIAPSLPPLGKTRVGIHIGDAVVGNFGGERRMQYTALGDAMNTAARLESANKAVGSTVLASRDIAEASGLLWWRPLGAVALRGRAGPVELYEPAPDFPEDDRASLFEAISLLGDSPATAIQIVQSVALRHRDDQPLQNMLYRLRKMRGGRAYELG